MSVGSLVHGSEFNRGIIQNTDRGEGADGWTPVVPGGQCLAPAPAVTH